MSAVPITGTNHTGLTVSDLNRSISFFRDVLGFDVSESVTVQGEFFEKLTGVDGCVIAVAYVSAPGHTIELLQYEKPDNRRLSDLRPCDTGFVHMSFAVADIDAVVEAIKKGGFEPISPPLTQTQGPRKGARAVYTRDADGVVFEFQQAPPQ